MQIEGTIDRVCECECVRVYVWVCVCVCVRVRVCACESIYACMSICERVC